MKYKVWWWVNKKGWFLPREEMAGNFGDLLTGPILNYFNIDFEYVADQSYDMLVAGSIARHAKPGTIMLGSGFMSLDDPVENTADWKFVRGPISQRKLREVGIDVPAYGDPAILLPIFVNESIKKHDVGIVPHWTHYDHIKNMYPSENVITVWAENPLDVVKRITECRIIISSSLHGIIIANAYNIPAAWVEYGKMSGDRTKFKDYYESINITNAVLSTMDALTFYNGTSDTTDMVDILRSYR